MVDICEVEVRQLLQSLVFTSLKRLHADGRICLRCRKTKFRVRGNGQLAGSGKIVTMRYSYPWYSMTLVGGMRVSLRIDGCFAQLDEISVTLLLS